LKIDRYVKDLYKRLDDDNNERIIIPIKDYDDDYYIEINSEPPRFAYYRHVRVEQCTDDYKKKSLECVHDTITEDELAYYLKSKLRTPPEQRYQDRKQDWFFHESSYSHRGLEAYDGQGCNGFTGCVPECRYFLQFGRIEDDEVIAEHRAVEEDYRKRNAIINIDINTHDYLEFARDFYNR
jgi:hypothetical protein